LKNLADSKSAEFFAAAIKDTAHLVVPVVTIYEIFKSSSLRGHLKR